MIKRMSHTTIYVEDQDRALRFYTEKLGLVVRTDVTMDSFRWLTLGTPDQPDLEIVLMQPKAGFMFDEATVKTIGELRKKGAFGGGVFQTDDCKKTYQELKAKGVEFNAEPAEKPYGIEAVFRDDSGNWFSLTQPKHA
jgi:catechol 2,3-dioxygenase-like lactoylglutathione lyase family enzyme